MDPQEANGTAAPRTLPDRPLVVLDRPPSTAASRSADLALGMAVAGTSVAGRLAGAGLTVGLVLARTGLRTAHGLARWVPPAVGDPVGRRVAAITSEVEGHGRAVREQAPIQAAGALDALLDRLVPWVLRAVLDRTDLTALVAERVDLDALVARVDLDAAVARVDLDAAVARVDLDAAVAGVDLDAAVARVDVAAVMRALDLAVVAELARSVVDAIDLPLIIRESSGGVAADLVTDVRLQTLDADQAVARFLDRVFRRGAGAVDTKAADTGTPR